MKRSAVESSWLRAKAMAFKKRKDTVKKKAIELSVLCDVPVAAIVFGPNGELETFPENQSQLKAVLDKFKDPHQAQKHNTEDSSTICLMNQLDAKIADVDHRIELLKSSANNVQSCFAGIGVQELLAQRHNWFGPFGISGAVDQGLACGSTPWSQNLGPNNYYTMVQNVVPIQVVEPAAAAYSATSLGCNDNAAAFLSLHQGLATSNSSTAGCESFGFAEDGFSDKISTSGWESSLLGFAEDGFLDNIELLGDHDKQQLHGGLDDADHDFFQFFYQ